MKKLKIAQISPYWFDVPPKDYGGTERVISYITEELVARGHEVYLFATPDSQTKAKLVSPLPASFPKGIEFYMDPVFNAINIYIQGEIFKRADFFDVIHSHAFYYSFPFADLVKTPVIHTLHNQLPKDREIENELLRKYKQQNFISISNEYRTHFDLNYISTVYHGLDLKYFPFNENGGDYLFWMGRLSKNKGEETAVDVAQKSKKKLVLAASIRKDAEKRFNQVVSGISPQFLEILRDVKFEETWKYYGNSRAFIFPVQWKEPFGLIIIESMACGSPVIAYAKGSIPELIKDGETGFIVNPSDLEITGNWIIKKTGVAGMCEAVERIFSLNEKDYRQMRKNCRTHVENNFTVKHMVDNYEKVYREVIEKRNNGS